MAVMCVVPDYIQVGDALVDSMWCDMEGGSSDLLGGWALVYKSCQSGSGGLGSNTNIDQKSLPILPVPGPVSSVPYDKVAATSPTHVRFSSDFQHGPGYLFEWAALVGSSVDGRNQMESLLNGPLSGGTSSSNIGSPLPGSNGVDCSMCVSPHRPLACGLRA